MNLAQAYAEDGDAQAAVKVLQEWQKIDAKRAAKYKAPERIARLQKGEPFDAPAAVAGGGTTTVVKKGEPGTIRGTVRIAPALAAKVPADAMLFMIAKSSPMERMPVAVERIPAKFPASFELSVDDAMMQGAAFEGRYYVTARVDVDGTMGAGKGDLEGTSSQAIDVGSTIELTIDKEIGGTAAAPHATVTAAPVATSAPKSGGGSRIAGTIDISPSLKAKLPSNATLFVFAKPNAGPGAPLAVLSQPVGSFPVSFELTENNVMMAGMPFEGALYVTARVDADGVAGGSPGDLEGRTASPVPVGTTGVTVTIDTVR